MRRTFVGLLLAVLLTSVTALPAMAQDAELQLNVRDTRLLADGVTELVVNVTGPATEDVLASSAFEVTEQGAPVEGLTVEPLVQSGLDQLVVMLVIDLSSSMEGPGLEQIRQAASASVEALTSQGIPVGIVTFNEDVDVLAETTTDTDALLDEIADLETAVGTALHDAILEALEQLDGAGGIGNVIVFSDGEDTASQATVEEVVTAATDRAMPLTVVALETGLTDLSVLTPLATGTGGRLVPVGETGQIGEVFAEVTDDIASQYVLRYTSDVMDTETLDLGVTVSSGGTQATTSFVVPNTREEPVAGPRIFESEEGLFSNPVVLIVGLVAAFGALALLMVYLFTGSRTQADRNLDEQLARYIEQGDTKVGRSSVVSAHFRDRALEILESTPRPKGFDTKLSLRLERAAWPLKNVEFIALVIVLGVGVTLLVGSLVNWLGGFLLGIVAATVPFAILSVRLSRRQDLFLKQLPDTLQLMAGSLRAGYGVLQSIDSVAKESAPPTSEEFGRVLTEARLGMPIEDALEEMADRIDNPDFRWVVMAINIQREVGGNLAELLDTVAEVLREREMLRRQIKVLSAEGRLSAYILIGLPIFLAIYLILTNPDYIGTLVTSGAFGFLLIGGAVFLMIVGVIWIRKLIRIEV